VLGEEAAAFARLMEKVTEILGEHQDAADAGAAIRELATSADALASFTLGVLHAADASGLRRPAAGSRRCGPKSAAASGADG
jgi:CHAD domain-containing protein